jgi:HK97 gp10 family phage protein
MAAVSADLASLALDLAAASGGGMQAAAQKVLKDAAAQIQAEAQVRAPMATGRLKESIGVRFTSPMEVTIGPTVPYARYMEFGTGSRGEFPGPMYVIRPRNAKVLAFRVAGRKVFAKVVHHPGVKARPYMRPAFEAVLGRDVVSKLLDTGVALITKGPNA